jgi:hypothetical protein
MKCSLIKISLILFLLQLTFCSFANVKSHSLAVFNENEAKSIATFAKYANCAQKPLVQTCASCMEPKGGYKMFFFYQYSRLRKYNYKVDNYSYVAMIYSRGWSFLRRYRIKVEREFKLVYFKNLRKILIEKLLKFKKSGRHNYKFIFTGYSLGGSLAVLSAFDLTRSKLLKNSINKTTAYTYGALRIGDHKFVSLINKTITLWRIVKQDDFIVRIPNCYYSVIAGAWRCFTNPVIRKFIVTNKFPLQIYYKNYVGRGPLGKLLIVNRRNHYHNGQHPQLRNVNPHHHVAKKVIHMHKFMNKHSNMNTPQKKNFMINPAIQKVEKKVVIRNNNEEKKKKIAQNPYHANHPNPTKASFLQLSTHSKKRSQQFRQYTVAKRQWVRPHIVPRNSLSYVRQVLLGTYYKYIYYSQPIGNLIYYTPDMTSYRTCAYINGISNCEKVVTLPASFTTASHKSYYGINFELC